MSDPRGRLPEYYKDFVLLPADRGRVSVTDVESYHAKNTKVLFTGANVDECLTFIDENYLKRLGPLYTVISLILQVLTFKNSAPVVEEPRLEQTTVEYAGWLKPFMDTKVGTHPVFNFTRHPPKGVLFASSGNIYLNFFSVFRIFSILSATLKYSIRFLRNGVPLKFVIKFWLSRNFVRGYLKIRPGQKTLALYPTYLFICPNHSWIVEIEDMLTLMSPFVSNGYSNPKLDPNHPIIKTMEVLFAGEECRGVLSHLKATADGLKKIYAHNPKVVQKIKHIPLGMAVPSRIPRAVTGNQRPINILYINGWAQDKRATFRRGLLDALKAFAIVSKEFDNVTLTVRSQLPDLDQEYLDILSDERVIVLEEKVHLSKLNELYKKSDILLFPAVRIAVTTLMQAMANSLAIVASDGFGIEEYVKDETNGLIGKGFHGRSGWIDEHGIFRENYLLSLRSNDEVAKNCANQLRRLIQDEALLVKMQNQARETLERDFSIDRWNEQFGPWIREIASKQ